MLEMEYTTLANEDMCWQRKDARSGGLLDWALHEMDSEEQERMLIPRSLTQPAAVVLPQPEKVVNGTTQDETEARGSRGHLLSQARPQVMQDSSALGCRVSHHGQGCARRVDQENVD